MVDPVQCRAGSKDFHLTLPHVVQFLIRCDYGAFAFTTDMSGINFHILYPYDTLFP